MLLASWLNGLKSVIGNRVFARSAGISRRRRRHTFNVANQLEPRIMLTAVMWDGGGGDFNWNNALNWDTDSLPGTTDDVTINFAANDFSVEHTSGETSVNSITSHASLIVTGGSLEVSSNSTIGGDLTVLGQFGGSGNVSVSGEFTSLSGTLRGGGLLTADGGAVLAGLVLSDGSDFLLPDGAAADMTAGVTLSTGSRFENAGSIDLQFDVGIAGSDDGSAFINSGTLTKSGGDPGPDRYYGSLFQADEIVNTGTIDVLVGTFGWAGRPADTAVNSGTITTGTGTTLWLLNGQQSTGSINADSVRFHVADADIGGTYRANYTELLAANSHVRMTGLIEDLGDVVIGYSGGGTLDLTAATFAPGADTLDSLALLGSYGYVYDAFLLVNSDLSVSGSFVFAAGTLRSPNAEGSLNVLTPWTINQTLAVDNLSLINSSDVIWSDGTISFYGSESKFINKVGATFTDTIDGTFGSTGGNCIAFVNEGLFVKTGGTGITYLQMLLYNRGTVEIQQGQLSLGCGYVGSPGNPLPPGIDPGPNPPRYEDPDPTPLPPESPPLIIPGSYTQTVTGLLIEQIAGHSGGTYGTPGTDYGQLVVNGDVALNGSFEVQLIGGFAPSPGQQFMAIDNRGSEPIAGTFIGLPEGSIIWVENYGFTISYLGGDGNDFVLTMDQFANSPPQADAGGPYTVTEGGTAILSAAGSSDAQQPSDSLIYAWDLDGDGIFGETGTAAGRGDETVIEPVFSAAGLSGPGAFSIQLRVTDEFGESDTTSAEITILNGAPVVTLTGRTNVNEGQTERYTFTTMDPGADTFSLVATSGGAMGTVSNLVFDSLTGSGQFDVTFRDGPTTSPISIQLQDSDGALSNVAVLNVTVANVAPTITQVTSSSADLAHKSLTGNVTVSGVYFDPALISDTHTVRIDWGDGTAVETLAGNSVNQALDTFQGTHRYATGGIFTITVTVLDEDGGLSEQVTTKAVVSGVGLVNGTLYIIGTNGRDHVNFDYKQNQNQLKVDVKFNQDGSGGSSECGPEGESNRVRKTYEASSIHRIVAYLEGGNDHYNGHSIDGSESCMQLSISQIVFGGSGDDHIKGGTGHDALTGGSGDDDIMGGEGHDILIGGTGKDKLKGNEQNDLLIGGSTANENDVSSIDMALSDWVSGNLTAALLNLGSITDDNKKDDLSGEKGNDHLIGGSGDKVKQ